MLITLITGSIAIAFMVHNQKTRKIRRYVRTETYK